MQPHPKTETIHSSWEDYLISFYDGDSEPRAYRLPYTRELHEQAQQALSTLMGGGSIGGTSGGEGKQGEGSRKGEGDGAEGQDGDGGGSLSRNGGIMFHDLPPTKLPDKD